MRRHESSSSPTAVLQKMAVDAGLAIESPAFAAHLDHIDPLKGFRQRFQFPQKRDVTAGKS